MISKALVKQIEKHSNRLTQEVLAAVRNDARTQAYGNLPDSALREAVEGLFHHLGKWLTSRTDYAVESRYRRIGRERYQQGIPLSQLVFALGLVRSAVLGFLRGSTVGEPDEVPLEHELTLAIADFIEKAIYYGALGYEDAQAAEAASPKAKEPDVSRLTLPRRPVEVWDPETEWDANISRGGDVGEVSG